MSMYSDIKITQVRFYIREATETLSNYLLDKDLKDSKNKDLKKVLSLLEQVERSDWITERF